MKNEDFLNVIEICKMHHSTNLTINFVNSGEVVSNARPIVIHTCCPAVINKLRTEEYMLSMAEEGLVVDKL